MRLPSWNEFVTQLSVFEKKVINTLDEFKEDHPLLDKAIKQGVIPILPPPFNAIADSIYSISQGSPEDKSKEVVQYFSYLKNRGQRQYEQIASRLDSILYEVEDLKQITAKESTVEQIQEILISHGKSTEKKIENLKTELTKISSGIGDVQKRTQSIEKEVTTINKSLKPS